MFVKMSEQEKQGSGGGKDSSAIVMVEQTSSVKPYRPTDLQKDSDVHHKRPKAPAVPSVTEELKILAEETLSNQDVQSMELKESDRAMSSEHKAADFKQSRKRRDSSPDPDIPPLRPKGVDTTKENPALKTVQKPSSTQPIPTQIQEEKSAASVIVEQAKLEEDSIMEEITELQTPDDAKKHSEWDQIQNQEKKKYCVSWNNKEYKNVVLQDLGTRSQDWFLERKASVGPCFRPGMPFEGPSGVMICVPKKSSKCINNTSGININILRKSQKSEIFKDLTNQERRYKLSTPDNKMDCDIAYAKIYNTLKEKMNTMRSKIRCVFNV